MKFYGKIGTIFGNFPILQKKVEYAFEKHLWNNNNGAKPHNQEVLDTMEQYKQEFIDFPTDSFKTSFEMP